jgi:DNA-binding transcriptional LysR family regulator
VANWLQVARSVATRQITALTKRLRFKLITRRLTLTPDGATCLENAASS